MVINISCLFIFIIWMYIFFLKKNYIHVITFLWWGIFFPLFLYNLNWSTLIDTRNCQMFNYMVIMIVLITIIYSFLSANIKPQKIEENQSIEMTNFGLNIAIFLNLLFIFLYLLENYMGSGTIIPGMKGIDIHNQYSAPVISYITNNSYLFLSFDFLAYRATGKKSYLVWILVIIAIPIITRSARMNIVMAIVQLLCLYTLFAKKNLLYKRKDHKLFKNSIISILCMCLAVGLMDFTNYRMSHYGMYDINYADTTGWNGPTFLKWLAPYYGYFPLSFNNLKINVANRVINHNYLGLYSFNSLYFGIFHTDRLFGIDSNAAISNNLITNGAANVPTGFWDFYYDYGVLFFIPFICALLILFFFLVNTKKGKNSLAFRALYCWYVTYFFFMSFQNTLYMSVSIIDGLLIFLIIKYSFNLNTYKFNH